MYDTILASPDRLVFDLLGAIELELLASPISPADAHCSSGSQGQSPWLFVGGCNPVRHTEILKLASDVQYPTRRSPGRVSTFQSPPVSCR